MENPRPITLAIEASNPGRADQSGPLAPPCASVALGRSITPTTLELIGRETVNASTRHDDDLLPAIDRLVRRSDLSPRELGRVAVSIGPGGFTGLRVAVAAAKMICEATGAECIPVPTARALIRRVDPATRGHRPAIILLAWKREDVWAERYAPGTLLEPIARGALERIDELRITSEHIVVCDPALEEILRERGAIPNAARAVRPVFDAAAVLEASAVLPPIDPLALEPLYPREPEAVTKWRELKKPSRG